MLSLGQLTLSVKEHLASGALNSPDATYDKWIVAESSVAGRGIIATQDIQPGEVIFIDQPLIYGPRAGAVIQRGCTICCRLEGDFFKCSRCALLLCSDDCRYTERHQADCEIIGRWTLKVPIEDVDAVIMSKALTPIRALLLDGNRKVLLSALQAHVLPQHGSEITNLKEFFDIPEEDERLMKLACCVLDANAFQIASGYGKDTMSLRGLYPVSSLMNHCCVSNTRHNFDKQNRMIVKAAKTIPANSEILSCYTRMLWGTPTRRHHLHKTKHFLCECERCADPTERGTYLAALKCFSKTCPGSLLPIEPLKLTSSWRCLECSMTVPAKQIGAIQSALGSLMGTLDFDDALQLEDFIITRLPKYIPRTNQMFMDLQCRLIWLFGETEGFYWNELPEGRLLLKESLCRAALRTLAALGAGDAHLRGLLLYHLHAGLAERARRNHQLYEELKPEIESSIEQAYRILQGDISAPSDLDLRRKYLGVGCDKPPQDRFFILDAQ